VSNDKRAADDAEREAIFRRIHNERGWMDLQDIFNAGWDEALSSRADGGKDSSDALFNACMTREIDPTGTPKEVIDRIIDWEISLERADGGKDSSHHDPSWQEGYKEGYDDSRLVALDEAAKVAYSHNAIMATTTAQLIEKAIRALIGVKK
jgi:hypothetical protein